MCVQALHGHVRPQYTKREREIYIHMVCVFSLSQTSADTTMLDMEDTDFQPLRWNTQGAVLYALQYVPKRCWTLEDTIMPVTLLLISTVGWDELKAAQVDDGCSFMDRIQWDREVGAWCLWNLMNLYWQNASVQQCTCKTVEMINVRQSKTRQENVCFHQ